MRPKLLNTQSYLNMETSKLIEKIVELALEEDIASGDVTTNSIVPIEQKAFATFKMKANGVICGVEIVKMVFSILDKDIQFIALKRDGDHVKISDIIIELRGNYRALLTGERTALNILQRLSGIATETSLYVKEVERTGTKILDTRKTAPGMRVLDKMAVIAGGGTNHRSGLYDMVLIKDNHIKIAGGISQAISQIRDSLGRGMKIEVETTNLLEVKEALECGADIIMLDNMDNETMREAVKMIDKRALTEASGNMNLSRVKSVAMTGVDYISVGALTHSVNALDISMNIQMS